MYCYRVTIYGICQDGTLGQWRDLPRLRSISAAKGWITTRLAAKVARGRIEIGLREGKGRVRSLSVREFGPRRRSTWQDV